MQKTKKELWREIARLRFVEKLKQPQIAARLKKDNFTDQVLSAKTIRENFERAGQWLLEEQAECEKRREKNSFEYDLAQQLIERLGLLDARVVPGGEPTRHDYAPLAPHCLAAAKYFDDQCNLAAEREEQLHVAVTGGQTIIDIVSQICQTRRSHVHYYAAALLGRGPLTQQTAHIGPETNATIAWSRSGRIPGRLYYGTVQPYIIDDDEMRELGPVRAHTKARQLIDEQFEILVCQQPVIDVLEDAKRRVNFVIGGLGHLRRSETDKLFGGKYVERVSMNWILKSLHLDLEVLENEGAIGDMCYAMFDRTGKGNPRWRFFITPTEGKETTGVEYYQGLVKKGCKVMVTVGLRKEGLVRPALKGGLFNVMITDAFTAQRLLNSHAK